MLFSLPSVVISSSLTLATTPTTAIAVPRTLHSRTSEEIRATKQRRPQRPTPIIYPDRQPIAQPEPTRQGSSNFSNGIDPLTRAEQLQTEGQAHLKHQRYGQAEAAFRRALAIYQRLNHPEGIGMNLNLIGEIQLRRDLPHLGQTYFQSAISLYHEVGNRQAEGRTLNNLALAYRHQDQFRQAAAIYRQAYNALEGDDQGQWTTLYNLGLLYYFQSRTRSSQEQQALLRRSLQLYEQATSLIDRSRCIDNKPQYKSATRTAMERVAAHLDSLQKANTPITRRSNQDKILFTSIPRSQSIQDLQTFQCPNPNSWGEVSVLIDEEEALFEPSSMEETDAS